MPRRHQKIEGASRDGNAVYDTGSSLYDSYELASLNRILDRHIADARPPSPDDDDDESSAGAPPVVVIEAGKKKQQQVVVVGARRKVTLRALFRGVASWAARPALQPRACTCVGVAPSG